MYFVIIFKSKYTKDLLGVGGGFDREEVLRTLISSTEVTTLVVLNYPDDPSSVAEAPRDCPSDGGDPPAEYIDLRV